MPARTGEQYLAGLAEAREIWLDGARVADVRTHPALRRGVASVARLYDMQYDPDITDTMTYPSPTTGEPVGTSFIIPRTLARPGATAPDDEALGQRHLRHDGPYAGFSQCEHDGLCPVAGLFW